MCQRTYFKIVLFVLFWTLVWYSAAEAATSKDAGRTGAAAARGTAGVDRSEVIISLGDEKLTLKQINWMQPDASDSQRGGLKIS
ncbi:MAG: hypothetical protein ACYTEQ_17600 [Planctomycetota bacterium]|jgi:hypothetical protein